MSEKSASQKISTAGGFIAGGIAACGAVTFSNPVDLVKTRMQLQGELSKGGEKIYKNPLQALGKIYQMEGIRGLQKGLFAAYVYQIGLNGCRLGLYEPVRNALNKTFFPDIEDYHKVQNIPINVVAGAISGMAGATVGSPLFLVKTRMQSYSPIAIGDQTHYKSVYDGLKQLYANGGFAKGLFKGVDAALIRTGMGSAVQLPIYNGAKNFLLNNHIVADSNSPNLHLLSSTIAGFGVGVVMNPGDVILTRVYNQKGQAHYSGPVDCLVKIVKYEGVGALYKGFFAQLMRICPHTILTLTFMEQTMKLVQGVEQKIFA